MDYIVMNSLRDPGAGFGTDTNSVTIFKRAAISNQRSAISNQQSVVSDEQQKEGESVRLPLASKSDIAEGIVSILPHQAVQ